MFHSSGAQVSNELLWSAIQRILCILKSLGTLKDTSLPHLFEIFHGIIISVEFCIRLLSWLSHAKLIGSGNSQGHNECASNMNPQTLGQKTTHLWFGQQRTGTHGSQCPLRVKQGGEKKKACNRLSD